MDSSSKQEIIQVVKFTGSETEYSAKIVGQDVRIQCSSGQHTHGSSKVKLTNKIDYNWEFNLYRGQLVAVHINGKLVAYAMKGKDGGMVRVTNQDTNHRSLIKNLKSDVKDVAFSFSKQQIILGCIDEEGNVFIYEIFDEPNAINHKLLLHVYHSANAHLSSRTSRIIWCPYIAGFDEEEDSSDDPERMFVILNGEKAEIWNVSVAHAKYGTDPIKAGSDNEGCVEITHKAELVDASFSSDGTAIAVASVDGYVKFFQIYMVENEKQKCLHEWRPHDGKQLSSIIFVDNLLECSSQCWKFTITGANHNSELKLWSCETWTCLQTIVFQPDPKSLIQCVYFKMCIDYTGQYLLMSDLNNKVLYVLQLKRNDEAQHLCVTMISQFLLQSPFLSFHITETSCKKMRAISEDYQESEEEEEEDEESVLPAVHIELLVIQQKKFQECSIVFQPETMLWNTDVILPDEKSDEENVPKLDDLQSSVTQLIKQQQQLNLMTPDDFTIDQSTQNGDVSTTKVTDDDNVENLIDFQRPEKDNFASGGSSPSREVQEILSLNNSTYSTQDYFDNLTKMAEEDIPQKEYTDGNLFGDNVSTSEIWLKLPLVAENEAKTEVATSTEVRLGGGDEIANNDEWNKTQIQSINYRLKTIENAINNQNIILQKLQQDVKNVSVKDNSDFSKDIDLAMSKQQLQIAKMLENLMNMQKTDNREQQEHMLTTLTQSVSKNVTDKLQTVLSNDIKLVIIPTIRNLIEGLKHQMDVQNSQRLSSDLALQDKISKMINSKALAESLSMSVASVVTPILEKCYRDMITSTLIPSWEKISGNMFQQINETFSQGTKEYTASVENYMERQRRVQEKSKDLMGQMQTIADNLQVNNDKLSTFVNTEMNKHLCTAVRSVQDSLINKMRDVVSEQIKLGFKNHASVIEDSVINAVRSRAVTPSPHSDTQITLAQLDHLLSKESYDEAFQLALSAENLNYVIYVCEKVDPNKLFGGPSPLQQNCILALIQQLSMDLTKNTHLKMNYIRLALVALDPGYPATKHFIPKVLKEVGKQLASFIAANPTSKYVNDAKILRMACESIKQL